MCGRYTLSDIDRVEDFLEVDESHIPPQARSPRFNIAPTETAPVLRVRKTRRVLDLARWGLVPVWAKDPAIGSKLINARAETIASKPSYRDAFRHRRCLVPANGYFEWKKTQQGKQPFLFQDNAGSLLAFGGVWERWRQPDGDWLISFSIVTTPPNEIAAHIHDRMPLILTRSSFPLWLDETASPSELEPLLIPFSARSLRCFPVSRAVNKAGYDEPDCVQEIEYREVDGPARPTQTRLF